MKISDKEAIALYTILSSREGGMYGLDVMKESENTFKRSEIYVVLNRMKEKGLLDFEMESLSESATRKPRRKYKVTPEGLEELQSWQQKVIKLKQYLNPITLSVSTKGVAAGSLSLADPE